MSPVIIGNATLYLGDCLEILPTLGKVTNIVTDPPYPNNAGHFIAAIDDARKLLVDNDAVSSLVFWSELEQPPSQWPLVAVHIWHRTNVNGRPYEPIYHFASDGRKRRSEVKQHAAIFDGAGPGCNEYAGHPTQKPVAVMRWLVDKTHGPVLDPFMGVGATGLACVDRPFIGIEKDRTYFDIACERIENAQRQERMFA